MLNLTAKKEKQSLKSTLFPDYDLYPDDYEIFIHSKLNNTKGNTFHSIEVLLLLLLEALQLQRSFGLLNEFLPFDPVSDAVLPVCYFYPCYIALYIILPSIFRSS